MPGPCCGVSSESPSGIRIWGLPKFGVPVFGGHYNRENFVVWDGGTPVGNSHMGTDWGLWREHGIA